MLPESLDESSSGSDTSHKKNPVNVVLCWHMHQPQYQDQVTKHFALPWTYLHAIKDYIDMATILEKTPKAKAVVKVATARGLAVLGVCFPSGGSFRESWSRHRVFRRCLRGHEGYVEDELRTRLSPGDKCQGKIMRIFDNWERRM